MDDSIVCPGCHDRFVPQPPPHYLDGPDGAVLCTMKEELPAQTSSV
jgi:hypothetical protein